MSILFRLGRGVKLFYSKMSKGQFTTALKKEEILRKFEAFTRTYRPWDTALVVISEFGVI